MAKTRKKSKDTSAKKRRSGSLSADDTLKKVSCGKVGGKAKRAMKKSDVKAIKVSNVRRSLKEIVNNSQLVKKTTPESIKSKTKVVNNDSGMTTRSKENNSKIMLRSKTNNNIKENLQTRPEIIKNKLKIKIKPQKKKVRFLPTPKENKIIKNTLKKEPNVKAKKSQTKKKSKKLNTKLESKGDNYTEKENEIDCDSKESHITQTDTDNTCQSEDSDTNEKESEIACDSKDTENYSVDDCIQKNTESKLCFIGNNSLQEKCQIVPNSDKKNAVDAKLESIPNFEIDKENNCSSEQNCENITNESVYSDDLFTENLHNMSDSEKNDLRNKELRNDHNSKQRCENMTDEPHYSNISLSENLYHLSDTEENNIGRKELKNNDKLERNYENMTDKLFPSDHSVKENLPHTSDSMKNVARNNKNNINNHRSEQECKNLTDTPFQDDNFDKKSPLLKSNLNKQGAIKRSMRIRSKKNKNNSQKVGLDDHELETSIASIKRKTVKKFPENVVEAEEPRRSKRKAVTKNYEHFFNRKKPKLNSEAVCNVTEKHEKINSINDESFQIYDMPYMEESTDKQNKNDNLINNGSSQIHEMPNEKSTDELENFKIDLQNSLIERIASPFSQLEINENNELTCTSCHQKLDENLKFYSGEPLNGFNEEVAITDSKLCIFNGNEDNVATEDIRACNRITHFSIFCEKEHLCSLDAGLIENDVIIKFSGYLKSIKDEDQSIQDSVPARNLGPILEWWSTGFDKGEEPRICLSTDLGEYYLMQPSKEYAPFLYSVMLKIFISKIIIEYLIYEPNSNYEDLLDKIRTSTLNYGGNDLKLSEETLFQYSTFICEQVISFDDLAEPDESLLIIAPCLRRLIDLSGIAITSANQKCNQINNEKQYNLKKSFHGKSATKNFNFIKRLLPEFNEQEFINLKTKQINRCDNCSRCAREVCSSCKACVSQNKDNCFYRRCFYSEIKHANDQDLEDKNFLKVFHANNTEVYHKKIGDFRPYNSNIKFIGDAIASESDRTFYSAVAINNLEISTGDFVLVSPSNCEMADQVMYIISMWADKTGSEKFHAYFFWHTKDTILNEIGDENEIVYINKCITLPISVIKNKANVSVRDSSCNTDKLARSVQYYTYQAYDPETGWFSNLSSTKFNEEGKLVNQFCKNCESNEDPRPMNVISKESSKISYNSIHHKNEIYEIGSCVYLKPRTLYFKYPMLNIGPKIILINYDLSKYPESSRISSEKNYIDEFQCTFDIGIIREILNVKGKLWVKIRKFYRPQNVIKGEKITSKVSNNTLFWSNEDQVVPFEHVIGKCYVEHTTKLACSHTWSSMGRDRFIFNQQYLNEKITDIISNDCESILSNINNSKNYPTCNKLRTLNIYAGCGGMALGLCQANVSELCWAVEADPEAIKVLKLNNPSTVSFCEESDNFLKRIIAGDTKLGEESIPQKEEVELLCGSLPWKNIESVDQINYFQNSSLTTFVSICEHYEPLYFIIETDERLMKREILFKLLLATFKKLGYQLSFGLLQAGCYGIPQDSKRTIILGTRSLKSLPKLPKPSTVFLKTSLVPKIIIDGIQYTNTCHSDSAPLRAVTVEDAISDLSSIKVQNRKNSEYMCESKSSYQKMMRQNMKDPIIYDHECNELEPIVDARISHVPKSSGADWRNLPNIEVKLKDGTRTSKLNYNYESNSPVLECDGCLQNDLKKKCEPAKELTLIPWCLAHSAKSRDDHWKGLYGRLDWRGFFPGGITNPEPLQGPFIHPDHPRLISVRELARARGFPDDYQFGNDTLRKYHMIGSDCSPLLAKAVGYEIAITLSSYFLSIFT
ncbi:DNA (cytosine-5)-methyltransferase 1-like [Trichogramma pretiosum]|uniref:DNA (cytosine-5)-methyltransferase 1-like n=1 Tax=Trichogramma pretiosum TaxID=7493 RepID=UPI0006C97E5E|nr:DNA (cytosine-5)-methyltransferase 1-like [Trichogramma pretiosum]